MLWCKFVRLLILWAIASSSSTVLCPPHLHHNHDVFKSKRTYHNSLGYWLFVSCFRNPNGWNSIQSFFFFSFSLPWFQGAIGHSNTLTWFDQRHHPWFDTNRWGLAIAHRLPSTENLFWFCRILSVPVVINRKTMKDGRKNPEFGRKNALFSFKSDRGTRCEKVANMNTECYQGIAFTREKVNVFRCSYMYVFIFSKSVGF